MEDLSIARIPPTRDNTTQKYLAWNAIRTYNQVLERFRTLRALGSEATMFCENTTKYIKIRNVSLVRTFHAQNHGTQ
jgi:hypothetical protein